MVDIQPQGTSWPGPTQYVQAKINLEPAGTHFVLKSGLHRMQDITLRNNDTLEFEAGAILRGSQDISGLTWTQSGSTWWASISDITSIGSGFSPQAGYELLRQWPVVNDLPFPFKDSLGGVTSTSCYYDDGANRLYLGTNPAGKTVELCRTTRCISAQNSTTRNVDIYGDRAYPAVIENYASGVSTPNAGIDLGRINGTDISNAGWTLRDVTIRNFRGMTLSHGSDSIIERITLYNTGQLGIGGANADGAQCYASAFYRNGMGGWTSGGEAGNSKWTHQRNQICAGNYFSTEDFDGVSSSHLQGAGVAWWDVDNDGCDIYSNRFFGRGASRGLFWEISWSVKIHKNVLYKINKGTDASQMLAIAVVASGAPRAGGTIYDKAYVYDNIMYECAGGAKATQETRSWPSDASSGDYGRYLTENFDVQGNVTQYGSYYALTEQTGVTGYTPAPETWGHFLWFDKNVYSMTDPESGHWRTDPDYYYNGGGSGTVGWTAWKAHGWDNNSVLLDPSDAHPRNDFNPLRGGAM